MSLMGANPIDIIVVVIILVSALLALVRGLVAEVFSIMGWILSFFAVLYGSKPLLPVFEGMLGGPGLLATGVTVGFIFVMTLVLMTSVSYLISSAMRRHHLSAIDRSLGFLFGLVRGGLLVSLLFIAVTFIFPMPAEGKKVEENTVQAVLIEAKTLSLMQSGAKLLTSFAPNKTLSVEDLSNNALTELLKKKNGTNGASSSSNEPVGYSNQVRDKLMSVIDRSENVESSPTNSPDSAKDNASPASSSNPRSAPALATPVLEGRPRD